jgi:hypothetical protein
MKILKVDIHLIDLETRLPFKYGIATMTCAPHSFVRTTLDFGTGQKSGIAADHLPPKWFTKDPKKPLDVEIVEMLRVIEHAVEVAVGLEAETVFDLWQKLYERQKTWGEAEGLAPLLWNFGVTLVERAMIDAFCVYQDQALCDVVRKNLLGIRLGDWDSELAGFEPRELLPPEPLRKVTSRQTIGMADPLTEDEIPDSERLNDGLPQSLEAGIKKYGLKHFKIKVNGNIEQDIVRIRNVAAVIKEHATPEFQFTMDGNEQFWTLDSFKSYWQTLHAEFSLQDFFNHLMFVEQPFHRDIALDAKVLGGLKDWQDHPHLIIDESDAEHDSLDRALKIDYQGTSHKNCKGVFRGIAHACQLENLRRKFPDKTYIMSGEDLVNIGPVALLQDLAVVATLGVQSVERNGHHYFAGLSAFSEEVQRNSLSAHGDLYEQSPAGWPTLNLKNGEIDITSVINAPFGVGFKIDPEQFQTVEQWRMNHELQG